MRIAANGVAGRGRLRRGLDHAASHRLGVLWIAAFGVFTLVLRADAAPAA
jgi:hypothetical protein